MRFMADREGSYKWNRQSISDDFPISVPSSELRGSTKKQNQWDIDFRDMKYEICAFIECRFELTKGYIICSTKI
ncbi:hypothetical protein CEXT_264161 [Caerostris extrusa]|uniref:Uncharacterized protein n=1 Tax=Caerostris extrusa TaxID=172846 RepID=A0AAV4P7Y7_CAEEX|nr:hypothetical protein CEXT_264161 [Caerostris extrusa]